MRNSSSPSLMAPIAIVVVLTAFMAMALLNLGQSASADQVTARVASVEVSARQG